MFFIIAEYLEKKFCDVFNIKKIRLAPIVPIYDTVSDTDSDTSSDYGTVTTMSCSYSTEEELCNLV